MSFTSISFVIFLSMTFTLYYLSPIKYRWWVLLLGNYIFYSFAGLSYILLLAYITLLAYFAGRYYEKNRSLRIVVFLSILALIIPLLYFKYTGFLTDNINIILSSCSSAVQLSTMQIVLPLGISFYTFAALGYVGDIVLGKYTAYKNPLHLAVGISFFPCLVAGPIERQNKLIPQLINGQNFNYHSATYGLKQIAWGLFEKIVIADNLALYVDKVFSDIHIYNGGALFIASIFFTFQIYCDFAGYSDIAIGVARLFGIQLTKNFACPYFSSSVQEFWKRWHISLSSWLKDYVYIPLGGNRKSNMRKQLNIMITMLVSGIWHGAAWTFVAWGGAYGIAQVIENIIGINKIKTTNKFLQLTRILCVFFIVSTLWVFFKASTFSDALYLLTNMFNGVTDIRGYVHNTFESLQFNKIDFAIIVIELFVLFIYDYQSLKENVIECISSKPLLIRWSIYISFILIIALLSNKGATVKFVYAGF